MRRSVAIITGASGGIGQATARTFASNGFNLVITAHSTTLDDFARDLHRSYQIDVHCIQGDLADHGHVSALVQAALGEFGNIDVLINNAAWRTIETMRTIDVATWQKTIAVNLTAPAFLAQQVAASMEQHKTGGTIINVTSVMAWRVAGTSPAYVACKGALEALTKELSVLYGRSGIRVLSVAPGYILTDMSADYKNDAGEDVSAALAEELVDSIPMGRPGTPKEIAEVLWWLSTPAASYITGSSIVVDGGFMSNFNTYSSKRKNFASQF